MVKSRTTSDEIKKSSLENKKKGLSEDKISSRIVLYIVSTLRLRKASTSHFSCTHNTLQAKKAF